MKSLNVFVALFAFAVCFLLVVNAQQTEFERQVLLLVNTERQKVGKPAYVYNAQLQAAARAHSEDMNKNNYFSHTSLSGKSFSTRISEAGYRWRSTAENIAKGQKTPADVMLSWMNSAGHKANILGDYKEIGVGLSSSGFLWTQTFGTRATACGNGLKEPMEDCDDGNTQSGDGCSSTCKLEPGWSCSEALPFIPVSKCSRSGSTTTTTTTTRPPATTTAATRATTTTATRATTTAATRATTTATRATTTATQAGNGLEQAVFRLVNEERRKAGLTAFVWSDLLARVARAHSEDMMTRNFFSHTNPEGKSPFDRMKAAGYSYSAAAENIAYGQTTAETVMTSWLNSAGHRANILGNYKEIGIGLSSSGWRWTQCFGTPR